MSEEKEKVLSEEERRRLIIEEAERQKILESFERVNNRVYTPEETAKIIEINRKIDDLKSENAKMEAEHDEKRAYYQQRIKKENIKPVLIPVYFILTFFTVVDLLCIAVFWNIFDQTPILRYAWVLCLAVIVIMAVAQIVFTRRSRKNRAPIQERITFLQKEMAENRKKIKELEAERDAV
ncbi:MAG: hypothetical protein J5849_06225 [Clostridia bacterium]|nr:hypothetical protein [Clostridia bacterium]MBR5742275.1 hypothetical protein [Clostridia bacterium]